MRLIISLLYSLIIDYQDKSIFNLHVSNLNKLLNAWKKSKIEKKLKKYVLQTSNKLIMAIKYCYKRVFCHAVLP